MRSFVVISLCLAATLAGCAATDNTVAPREEKQVVTGSNIPRRDRADPTVTVMSREQFERAQNSAVGGRGPDKP